MNDPSFGFVEFSQAPVNFRFVEIVPRHFDKDVAVLGFGRPKPVVELLQFGVVLNGFPDKTKTFRAATFDDGGEQQTVEETIERISAAKVEKRLDIRVLGDFFSQTHATFYHVRIDLLKMVQLLNGRLDEIGDDFDAVGILGDETHRHRGGFPLAISVVLQEGGKIRHNGRHPFRTGGHGRFE